MGCYGVYSSICTAKSWHILNTHRNMSVLTETQRRKNAEDSWPDEVILVNTGYEPVCVVHRPQAGKPEFIIKLSLFFLKILYR